MRSPVSNGSLRLTRKRDGNGLPRIAPAPDAHRLVTLKHHVVGDDVGQRQAGVRAHAAQHEKQHAFSNGYPIQCCHVMVSSPMVTENTPANCSFGFVSITWKESQKHAQTVQQDMLPEPE